jgi:hypothetical protein
MRLRHIARSAAVMAAAAASLLPTSCHGDRLPPTLQEWSIWRGVAETSPWLNPANRVAIGADDTITIHADTPYSVRAVVLTPEPNPSRCIYNPFRINWAPTRNFDCYPEQGREVVIERNLPTSASEFRGRPASGASLLRIELEERSAIASSPDVYSDQIIVDLHVIVPECPCP